MTKQKNRSRSAAVQEFSDWVELKKDDREEFIKFLTKDFPKCQRKCYGEQRVTKVKFAFISAAVSIVVSAIVVVVITTWLG